MTVKKAIQKLDWWIEQKESGIKILLRKWNYDSIDESMGISKTLLHVDRTIIANLESIRAELVPKCNHPKKLHDKDSDGNLYCMGCNLDL
jgi:hypothetical protein